MSLILDALRKLERDKLRPGPGVVVVGAVPWHGLGPSRWLPVASGVLVAVVLLAAGGVWLRSRPRETPPPPAPPGSSKLAAAVAPVAAPVAASAEQATPVANATPSSTARPETAAPGPAPAQRRLAVPAAAATAGEPAARADATPGEPGRAGAAPHAPLQLMAISERDGRPVAIISDHFVREGDSFDGVKVLRIGAAEVEVDDHGQRRVLRF